jgi:hypothetical protein
MIARCGRGGASVSMTYGRESIEGAVFDVTADIVDAERSRSSAMRFGGEMSDEETCPFITDASFGGTEQMWMMLSLIHFA